jgi:TP901 family phage tail tape measure protein
MRDLAVASTATGASMGDLGALAANLRDKMGLANDEIKGALATLTSQGKQGAFTLQNMAAMGERLFSAAGRFDVQGMEGIKQFGALVQVARMGTGSSEQATTAIEGMLADIIDKQKQIRKHARGFDIFKPGTKGELKSIDQVIKGIVRGTGGDITKLQQIFGRESIRGISTLAKVYKDTGGFDLFDKIAAGGDPAVLMKDFARYSESAAFQMQQLKNMGTLFADSALSPIIADLSDRLREFTSDPARVEAFVSQIRALGSEIGNLATFLMQLADNPIVKTFILNPVRAVGAYAEWIDAAGNQAAREQTRAARTRAGYSMMPKHLKADIRKRLAAGERVNLEREVMQWQTRQQLKAQNTVNIRNEIHTDGRVYTTSDDLDTTVNSDTKRGSMILDQD